MNILRDSTFLFVSNILLVAVSLVTGVLTARFLGPDGKGELYLVLQASSLASLVLSGGLGPSYQYHLKKKLLDASAIVSHIVMMSTGVILLLGAMAALLRYVSLPLLESFVPARLALPFAAATILNLLLLYVNSILMTFESGIQSSSVLSILSSVANVVFLALFVCVFGWGVIGAIAAYLTSLLVRLVPTLAVIWRQDQFRLGGRWRKNSRMLFAFGLSSFLCNLMLSSVFRVDVFIVNALAGVGAVGIYSVAVSFAEMALMAPNAIGIALFSHLPGVSTEEQLQVVTRSARITILIAAAGALILGLLSEPLVLVLMGKNFAGAVRPLILLLPGLVVMSGNYVFANFYASQGKPLVSACCFSVGLMVNVVANYFLIPLAGINGAAVASSVAYACITLSFYGAMRRGHRLTPRDVFVVNEGDLSLIREKLVAMKLKFCGAKG